MDCEIFIEERCCSSTVVLLQEKCVDFGMERGIKESLWELDTWWREEIQAVKDMLGPEEETYREDGGDSALFIQGGFTERKTLVCSDSQ